MKNILAAAILAASTPAHTQEVMIGAGMSNARDIFRYGGVRLFMRDTVGVTFVNCGFASATYDDYHHYWTRCADKLADVGLTLDDVTQVWSHNTVLYQDEDADTVRAMLVNGQVKFQGEVVDHLPNVHTVYFSVRSNGDWCEKAGPLTVSEHPAAIVEAMSYGAEHINWVFGPDLSQPVYEEIDFRDGCHFLGDGKHPSPPTGKQKIATVVQAYPWGEGVEPPPVDPPICEVQ